MNKPNFKPNTLWTGDNLPIMRGMNSACVDLVYLDPPFNSKTNFSAPIGSKAAGAAFKDSWSLSDLDVAWLGEIAEMNPRLHAAVRGAGIVHGAGMQSYLTMMGVRLLEIQRILKPTGSVWLHCDPTASHYLKLLMDAIFGKKNHLNDVVWKRFASHSFKQRGFDTVSDLLLLFTRDRKEATFNKPFTPLDSVGLAKKFPHTEKETGRRYHHEPLEKNSMKATAGETRIVGGREVVSTIGWMWAQRSFDNLTQNNPYAFYWTRNGRPRYKLYADEHSGGSIENIWTDIPSLSSRDKKEKTGYPTQKPLALLKRIIEVSSNPGDLVMDPFCGCATALVAARNCNREWVGIDLSEVAQRLVHSRMDGDGLDTYGKIHLRTDLPVRNDVEKIPHYRTQRQTLYGRQEGLCKLCRLFFEFRHMAVDHIVPRDAGGGDQLANLQMLCTACNSMKGTRSMPEAIVEARKRGIRRD